MGHGYCIVGTWVLAGFGARSATEWQTFLGNA